MPYNTGMYGKHHNKVVKVGTYVLASVAILSMVVSYFAGTF
jgi:hypothetical protein